MLHARDVERKGEASRIVLATLLCMSMHAEGVLPNPHIPLRVSPMQNKGARRDAWPLIVRAPVLIRMKVVTAFCVLSCVKQDERSCHTDLRTRMQMAGGKGGCAIPHLSFNLSLDIQA